jgi:hypothetical protein
MPGAATIGPLHAITEASVALLVVTLAAGLLWGAAAVGHRARFAAAPNWRRSPPLGWFVPVIAPLRAIDWCVHLDPLSNVGYARTLCYYPFDLARRAR